MLWKYVQLHVDDLHEQEKNPRTISKKQAADLSKSLKKFGLAEPIVVTIDGVIIGGHQRYAHMVCKGANTVSCMQCEEVLDESQIDELTIRLNKNSGEFDFDLLANSYDPELLLEWGFSMDELHLESIPEQEDKPKFCQLTAKFDNEDDLRQAEIDIAAVIDKYASASYKVKIK